MEILLDLKNIIKIKGNKIIKIKIIKIKSSLEELSSLEEMAEER